MFKSQQYRAKATECGELVKSSGSAEESREFQDLEDRFVSLADNERALADAYNNAVHVAEKDRTRGAALAAEDEHVLRCLGAAVIMTFGPSLSNNRGGRQSLFRDQYNALGKLNLAALQRIVTAKYQRGAAFNRQHPFVEVLFSDITESGEVLDLTEFVREPLPLAFHRLT